MRNTHTILLHSDLTVEAIEKLEKLFTIVRHQELAFNKEKVKAIITTGGVKVDATLMRSLPNLEVISTRGVGYDHIDLTEASKLNILVSNTPGVLTDCVADLAFGAILAISRKIVQADTFVREGRWLHEKFPMTSKVSKKRLGIVGFGRIGQAISKRALGFDMEVHYFSRSEKKECKEEYESSLLNLAQWSDYLVLSAPGGKSTHHMISSKILEALGSRSFIINIARGSLIDESALIYALEEGKIKGAALDVFSEELKVPKKLLESENVILLPHVASRTEETFIAMEELLIDNLEKYFTTGSLVTPVKKG